MDYRHAARAAAIAVGINPDLFERQIGAESNFNPGAVSKSGARGIAQRMTGSSDPISDLHWAARTMAGYIKQFGGWEGALRAYNAGPNAVEKSKGYGETNAYVSKIMGGVGAEATTMPPPGKTYMTSSTKVPGMVKNVDTPAKTDTDSAILDVLMAHKSGSKLKQLDALLSSGQYTTPGSTKTVPVGGDVTMGGGVSGSAPASVQTIMNRANIIDRQHRKYLYGGGHGQQPTLANPTPLDCSAAVSLATNITVRTSGDFAKVGQPGRGTVNLYFNSGHVFMGVVVNGTEHFWGTSGFGHPSKGTGAGWFTVKPGSNYMKGFQVRHVA